jgi:hypothetical protein
MKERYIMNKYVVSQIVLTNAAPQLGQMGDQTLEAYRDAMMGYDFVQSNGSVQATLDLYSPVMNVEAESLDHVYHLTNVWNDESKVERLDRCRSTSVGDLILDTETDYLYMVDTCGFRNVATGEQA